jgi:hypothetical protein
VLAPCCSPRLRIDQHRQLQINAACKIFPNNMASHDAVEGVAPSEKPAFVDEKDRGDQDHIARLKAKDRLLQGAKAATENEQNMTLMQGIRLYPKAIAWSILISTCIVMEGYDICLINNFCKCSLSPISGAPKQPPWAELMETWQMLFPSSRESMASNYRTVNGK